MVVLGVPVQLAQGMGRICEEEIGLDVNVSIFFRLLEDTYLGDWNAEAE